jgi:hypothetical protein
LPIFYEGDGNELVSFWLWYAMIVVILILVPLVAKYNSVNFNLDEI